MNRYVIFSRENVTFEKEVEAPAPSSGDIKIVSEDVEWDSFPMELNMEVTNVEPVPSEADESSLSEIRFTVSHLERHSSDSNGRTTRDFWEHADEEIGITKRDGEISLNGNITGKDNLATFVEFLIENEYLTEDDLPIESGWKRYLINTEPKNQDGDAMTAAVEVADSVFVETKFSRGSIRKNINELAEQFAK